MSRRDGSAAATIGFGRAIRTPHRHETRETALKAESKRVLGVAAAILLITGGAEARITRLEIVDSEPAFGGASWEVSTRGSMPIELGRGPDDPLEARSVR